MRQHAHDATRGHVHFLCLDFGALEQLHIEALSAVSSTQQAINTYSLLGGLWDLLCVLAVHVLLRVLCMGRQGDVNRGTILSQWLWTQGSAGLHTNHYRC